MGESTLLNVQQSVAASELGRASGVEASLSNSIIVSSNSATAAVAAAVSSSTSTATQLVAGAISTATQLLSGEKSRATAAEQSLGISVASALSSALTVSASLALSGTALGASQASLAVSLSGYASASLPALSALGASQASLATSLSSIASIPALASLSSSLLIETSRAQRAEASIAGLIGTGTLANPAASCLAIYNSNPSLPNAACTIS